MHSASNQLHQASQLFQGPERLLQHRLKSKAGLLQRTTAG